MKDAGLSTSVLIAPTHTFLLRNRTYSHQLWLDVGSPSWHRRIHQPLTGDELSAVVRWNGNGDLSALKDRSVSVRLHMHKAKVFSTAL